MLIHGGPPGLSLPVNDSYHGSLQASTSLRHLQSFTGSMTRERQRGCKSGEGYCTLPLIMSCCSLCCQPFPGLTYLRTCVCFLLRTSSNIQSSLAAFCFSSPSSLQSVFFPLPPVLLMISPLFAQPVAEGCCRTFFSLGNPGCVGAQLTSLSVRSPLALPVAVKRGGKKKRKEED